MKKVIFATALAICGAAYAQTSTPAQTMQQFCTTLETQTMEQATIGLFASDATAEEKQLISGLVDRMFGEEMELANALTSQSRCEVVRATGNIVTMKTRGVQAEALLEATLKDDDMITAYMAYREGKISEEEMELLTMSLAAKYASQPNIPTKAMTVSVEMERNDSGAWIPTDAGLDNLLEGLMGGFGDL